MLFLKHKQHFRFIFSITLPSKNLKGLIPENGKENNFNNEKKKREKISLFSIIFTYFKK